MQPATPKKPPRALIAIKSYRVQTNERVSRYYNKNMNAYQGFVSGVVDDYRDGFEHDLTSRL